MPVSFEGLILCHFAFFRNEIDSSVGKKAIKEFFIQMKKAFNDMVGLLLISSSQNIQFVSICGKGQGYPKPRSCRLF